MINKQSIYYWFFFPLLALLSAGSLTSCIYDSVLEEEATYGKTSLVVTVRSITTASDDATTYYDEYVKTLRIIGFDASGKLVCNGFYDQLDQVTNAASIEITQELQNFQGGTCKLYFIANEDNYTTTSNATSLTAFLEDENSTLTEKKLNDCIINASSTNDSWGTNPILMTAQTSVYIQSGKTEQNIGTIELVRCVAKVQLIVQKDKEIPEDAVVTISNVSLHGTRPDSYSLLDTKSYFAANSDEYTHDFTITNSNVGYGIEESPAYSSGMVYFPETLSSNNTTEGVLYFTFTLTYGDNATEKTYTIAIGDDANDDGVVEDYNIYRNTIYTVTATLQPTTNPEMNIEVVPWAEVEVDVPPFE